MEERRDELGDRIQLVDVRNPGEVESGPVDGAVNLPLARLRDRLDELARDEPVVLFCAGGARSAVAITLLRSAGFADVSDLVGGFSAWSDASAAAPSS
ncbi:MAG: rhodanese-like domain-containing protein [Microthrixaceae bacterium]|nr:rhodanese-like domain-containing protein [Microthrixaceae bacterium]